MINAIEEMLADNVNSSQNTDYADIDDDLCIRIVSLCGNIHCILYFLQRKISTVFQYWIWIF